MTTADQEGGDLVGSGVGLKEDQHHVLGNLYIYSNFDSQNTPKKNRGIFLSLGFFLKILRSTTFPR